MKYAIIKIRNSLDGLNRRMAITKKKSQRTWERLMEITQCKEHYEKWTMLDNTIRSVTHRTVEFQKERRNKLVTKRYF